MRKVFPRVLVFVVAVHFLFSPLRYGYAQNPSDAATNIAKIKSSLLVKKQEAQHELSVLQEHLQKVEQFISSLDAVKDKESIIISRQAIEKDRAAVNKINLRLKEIDQRLTLAERAEKNLNLGSGDGPELAAVDFKGDIRVLRQGLAREVKFDQGMHLGPGDVIKTGKDSGINLVTVDGSSIEISSNSEFRIMKDQSDSFSSELNLGMIKAKIHKLLYSRYTVHTPGCAVSVRGTEFEVTVDEKGLTRVAVVEGEVEVQKTFTVSGGQKWSEK